MNSKMHFEGGNDERRAARGLTSGSSPGGYRQQKISGTRQRGCLAHLEPLIQQGLIGPVTLAPTLANKTRQTAPECPTPFEPTCFSRRGAAG